jgi:hypothetical protein
MNSALERGRHRLEVALGILREHLAYMERQYNASAKRKRATAEIIEEYEALLEATKPPTLQDVHQDLIKQMNERKI